MNKQKKLLTLSLLILSLGMILGIFLRVLDQKELTPVGIFLQKECEVNDSASGCFNLALFRQEDGRKALAKTTLKRACQLGHSKACSLKL